MLQALGHIYIYIYPHVKGLLNSALQHIHVLTRAFVYLKKKKKTRALDNSLSSQCLESGSDLDSYSKIYTKV